VNVLTVAEHPPKAISLWHALTDIDGIRVQAAIFNERGLSPAAFRAWCVYHIVRTLATTPLEGVRPLTERAIVLFPHGIHDERTYRKLEAVEADVGLHASGVIYREPFIDCFNRGILNPHIGLLPEFRGRSVMEWSILEGEPTGITTFFVDEGIDTGSEIVHRERVPVPAGATIEEAKRSLLERDVEMFAKALRRIRDDRLPDDENDPSDGSRYYVMSDLLRDVTSGVMAEVAEEDETYPIEVRR